MEMKPSDSTSKTKQERPYRGIIGSWLSLLLHVILTFNFVVGLYRSINDPQEIVFLVFSYSVLILFFWVLNQFNEANPERRKKLKVLVWLLPTVIILMFVYRVSWIMPFPVKVMLWGMASLCTGSTFYICFLHPEISGDVGKENDSSASDSVQIVIL